jgi:hypothetical protein
MERVDPATLAPMTVDEAMDQEGKGFPWRVRLVFVGPNAQNASGRSDKWWEATSKHREGRWVVPGLANAVTRWGANGSLGQSKDATSGEAFRKAREKIAKGYVYDDAIRVAAPPPPASLQDLVDRAPWREVTRDALLLTVAREGLVATGIEAMWRAPRAEAPVSTYLATDGKLYGIARLEPTLFFSVLRLP